jgi:hypothetical protein
MDDSPEEAAAAELGIAKSTLRERLDHGRSLLRLRLEKRGFGPVGSGAVVSQVGKMPESTT